MYLFFDVIYVYIYVCTRTYGVWRIYVCICRACIEFAVGRGRVQSSEYCLLLSNRVLGSSARDTKAQYVRLLSRRKQKARNDHLDPKPEPYTATPLNPKSPSALHLKPETLKPQTLTPYTKNLKPQTQGRPHPYTLNPKP